MNGGSGGVSPCYGVAVVKATVGMAIGFRADIPPGHDLFVEIGACANADHISQSKPIEWRS
jgi:hypothetical protein